MKAEIRAMRRSVVDAYQKAQSILVSSHIGIDGDSAGGALALIQAGRKAGKSVFYQNAEPIPQWLSFMPGFECLSEIPDPEQRFDLGIIIDTSAPERVGSVWKRFEGLQTVVIDHHMGNGGCSAIAWIDPKAASVTVMIAELFEASGIEIDLAVAYPLYLGLFTDTFSFQQTNTDVRAMEWAARFLAAGVKPYELAAAILERKALAAVKLSGRVAARAEIESGICWSSLNRKDFEETGAGEGDTEGIIATLRCVRDIRVAVLFREVEGGQIKVNFRAKDSTDVAAVASEFGGGGHRAAAGCTLPGTLDEVRRKIMNRLAAK